LILGKKRVEQTTVNTIIVVQAVPASSVSSFSFNITIRELKVVILPVRVNISSAAISCKAPGKARATDLLVGAGSVICVIVIHDKICLAGEVRVEKWRIGAEVS
jgi:hypothetical protein